ncbi:hypothetical protein GQ53DRAFT_646127, partial [Thozetella sp. PMI_491]
MPSSPYLVHLGVWTNWSYGRVYGSTITLTKENGAFLLSFIAFYVTIVGYHLWRIIGFSLHRFLSTPTSEDGLHHQRQVILRNSSSPLDVAWTLLRVALAWKKVARHP